MLSNDDELSKLVQFRIQPRRQSEESRFEMVLEYQGPDEDTLEFLRSNHSLWLQNPSLFWICPSPALADSFDPQAQIVHRYLQNIHDSA